MSFSMALGWSLFVLSFVFRDIFSLMIAKYFHGKEGAKVVAVDQPGTIAAVFVGWFPALVGHFLGRGMGRLRKFLRSKGKNYDDKEGT